MAASRSTASPIALSSTSATAPSSTAGPTASAGATGGSSPTTAPASHSRSPAPTATRAIPASSRRPAATRSRRRRRSASTLRRPADAPTIVNLAQHSYFNLDDSADILDHRVRIDADAYTPTDEYLVPTGEIRPVDGTGYDLRTLAPIRLMQDGKRFAYDINLSSPRRSRPPRAPGPPRIGQERRRPRRLVDRAGRPVLRRRLCQRRRARPRRPALRPECRLLLRAAALPGRTQPPGVPERGAPAGRDLPADDAVRVFAGRRLTLPAPVGPASGRMA